MILNNRQQWQLGNSFFEKKSKKHTEIPLQIDLYCYFCRKITKGANIMDESMVMFTVSQLKIMTAQHVLKEAGIQSFVVDKMDSAHAGIFGEIELYVAKENQLEAKLVLIENEILT